MRELLSRTDAYEVVTFDDEKLAPADRPAPRGLEAALLFRWALMVLLITFGGARVRGLCRHWPGALPALGAGHARGR